ncbi:hypothetical protein CES85_2978 (plasmid) [Ochrobactrum quorumnocens]|uniref:Uncharacterized protein n=1 Tax=Ochrobactrum quorumnocens TaxID=271865 RepID=A0A248UN49_9HYPH|nr:hypothetical protein CES85_2978 [[Ochrobactrum] quorumnocens]
MSKYLTGAPFNLRQNGSIVFFGKSYDCHIPNLVKRPLIEKGFRGLKVETE